LRSAIRDLDHENYVILDNEDMKWYSDIFSVHQVVVDPQTGLTKENADQAIVLFEKWSKET